MSHKLKFIEMEKVKVDELKIDGTIYVPKDSVSELAPKTDGMDYVLVRTYSAGVHCGYLKSREGKEVTLINSIRLWKWAGAAACSQLSQDGVSKPNDCKFERPVFELLLTEAIEVHKMTQKAMVSIKSVPSWTE